MGLYFLLYGLTGHRNRLRPNMKSPQAEMFIGQHNQEMKAWARLLGMDQNMISNFTQYERSIRGNDPRFAGIKGPDLGKAIQDAEREAFLAMSQGKGK